MNITKMSETVNENISQEITDLHLAELSVGDPRLAEQVEKSGVKEKLDEEIPMRKKVGAATLSALNFVLSAGVTEAHAINVGDNIHKTVSSRDTEMGQDLYTLFKRDIDFYLNSDFNTRSSDSRLAALQVDLKKHSIKQLEDLIRELDRKSNKYRDLGDDDNRDQMNDLKVMVQEIIDSKTDTDTSVISERYSYPSGYNYESMQNDSFRIRILGAKSIKKTILFTSGRLAKTKEIPYDCAKLISRDDKKFSSLFTGSQYDKGIVLQYKYDRSIVKDELYHEIVFYKFNKDDSSLYVRNNGETQRHIILPEQRGKTCLIDVGNVKFKIFYYDIFGPKGQRCGSNRKRR